MSDIERIAWTSIATILGGVIIYAMGHLFVALFVEPIHRLRGLIAEIADSLIFYAPVYSNPSEVVDSTKSNEASQVLRRQASQLRARTYLIPWYSLWAFLGLVRWKKDIENASKELIGISNTVYSGPSANYGLENDSKRKRIEELLGISSSKPQGSEPQEHSASINRYCLHQGILCFSFALLLFGLFGLKGYTLTFSTYLSLTIPAWFIFGILILIATIPFMVGTIYKHWGDQVEYFLVGRPKSIWQVITQVLMYMALVLVFYGVWVEGFSDIVNKIGYHWLRYVVIIIGLTLLIVIFIAHSLIPRRQTNKPWVNGFLGFFGFLGFQAFTIHNPWLLFFLSFFSFFLYFKYVRDELKYLGIIGAIGFLVAILGIAGVIKV